MNADVSRTDDSNDRRSGWTPIYLFHGVWVCLGLAFVWLAWNTYHTYHSLRLVWSFVTPAVILAACLSMWHTLICRRHYQHLLSSMQRSERERTERVLQESAAHYWDLFENASDFIYTLDMQRHFTSTNKAAERFLGYTRDDSHFV